MSIIQGNAKQGSTRGFYSFPLEQSLRFNDGDSPSLSFTFATPTNNLKWTMSWWEKRGEITTPHAIFSAPSTGSSNFSIGYSASGGSSSGDFLNYHIPFFGLRPYVGAAQYRDVGGWMHHTIVFDSANDTQADRFIHYVNGVRETATTASVALNQACAWNQSGIVGQIGKGTTGYADVRDYFDGYLAEVNFIDGQALDADSFGELKSGVWIPKNPSGLTYGTNGFRLDFANSADIGNDVSGEGNDWTPNNFTASDVVLDSPTDNFCTWNPIAKQTGSMAGTINYSNGNLTLSAVSVNSSAHATFLLSSGKWYWEINCDVSNYIYPGIAYDGSATIREKGVAYWKDGRKAIDNVFTSYGASYTTGDVIGIALNADDNEITFYKNNVSQGAIAYTPLSTDPTPGVVVAGGITASATANFGQDSSFAGNKTAQGNTDDNGRGDFYYTPPSGYLALSTANLPEPTISPADDASPADYFGTLLYTGDSTTDRLIATGESGVTGDINFTPDFVWIKNRNAANSHTVDDVVRGAGTSLFTNAPAAEVVYGTDGVDSFNTDGFTVSHNASNNQFNLSGRTYVAWNWKANGSGVSNTDGSITSTVSANTTSGFSIVSWTGTGAAGATVGHGLGQTPDMIIQKAATDGTYGWNSWHKDLDTNYYIALNSTSAQDNSVNIWPTAGITSSVFTTASTAIKYNNLSGVTHIAYCFYSVEGFSKFGSYTGNGSADGPFVYTGFRPAWIMVKRSNSTGGSWLILDSERSAYNLMSDYLLADTSGTEVGSEGTVDIDFLSNGFKPRSNPNGFNGSGDNIIYMAFAENPFKYSNAR